MMRVAPLIRVVATLLSCLPSVGVAQGTGRGGRGGRGAGTAASSTATVVQQRMPPVMGLSLAEAQKVVSSRTGLQCGATNPQGGTTSPSDSVIRQFPAANQPVPSTAVCTLYVVPRASPQVPLTPNVVGKSMQDAMATLKRAELRPVIRWAATRDTALNSVIEQDPPANSPIPPDRTITLRFAGVPDVVGMSLADAVKVLDRAHLQVGSATPTDASSGQDSTVLNQRPAAGDSARPFSAVDLTIARVVLPTVPQTPVPPAPKPPPSRAAKPPRQTVRIVRLTIVPESISIRSGATVRMTAVAHMSDSSESRVTATWSASGGSITTDGRFSAGKSMGRVVVTGSQGGRSGTAVIRVGRPWWIIALIVAGLAGLGWIGWLTWKYIHRVPPPPPPPPPPPLAFTYDYKLPAPATEIATSGSHGPDLALVSYAGESEYTIKPRGDKLFDEEKSYG